MSVELFRIDDRLIHGQVVVGWGQPLDIRFLVLVDDAVASSDWEQELYRMAVPPGMDVCFVDVDTAAKEVPTYLSDRRNGIVITGDVLTMVRLVMAAPAIRAVNVGGIHHGSGRTQKLRYVFLTDEEERALKQLEARGVQVTAQDVPTSRAVDLDELLEGEGA
jgi:mannose/fructose/N-acetylgalactosamine-specific phosphotransferase system component IIB